MSAARLTKPNHQTTRHADHPLLVVRGVVPGVARPGTCGSVTAANLTTLADRPDVAAGPTLVWAGPAVVLWCLSDLVLS